MLRRKESEGDLIQMAAFFGNFLSLYAVYIEKFPRDIYFLSGWLTAFVFGMLTSEFFFSKQDKYRLAPYYYFLARVYHALAFSGTIGLIVGLLIDSWMK